MTVNATASLSATVLSSLHQHGHKKAGILDSLNGSGGADEASAPKSTQNLFSNLFTAVESVVGAKTSALAGAASALAKSQSTGTVAATSAPTLKGSNVNAIV